MRPLELPLGIRYEPAYCVCGKPYIPQVRCEYCGKQRRASDEKCSECGARRVLTSSARDERPTEPIAWRLD